MSKDPDSTILPHLRPEELSDRDHEELKLGRQLSACWRGDDFDIERSYNVMQGSAELIFDVIYAALRKRSGYKDEWVPEIVRLAAFRTISTSLGHIQHGIRNLSLSALTETLEETIWSHLEELKKTSLQAASEPLAALTGKQAAAYALSGIDIASASPLLKMAIAAASAPTHASRTPAVDPSSRKALFESHRSKFPNAGIMDVCWAARQHYREWARWLKGQLKDGSKPDRAFRFVLSSNKEPIELRKEIRPKNWK